MHFGPPQKLLYIKPHRGHMAKSVSRHQALEQLGKATAGAVLTAGGLRAQNTNIVVAGKPVEIAIASVSAVTARITVGGTRRINLRQRSGSRLLPPNRRPLEVRLAGQTATRAVMFEGKPIEVGL
jgi:hypothetical protein